MADFDWRNHHDWDILHLTSRDHVGLCLFESILGPAGAIAEAIESNFNQHGWELWERS